ncbi:hypothetical protein GCM10009096_23390 [Parasphingorhabdus litoris]|uniref:Uncharacterized protein n=1 Tax=Parasphingorhabdus litoris TaxID=394733 RepID=A0ABN1ANJ2_9SPHN
MLGDLSKPSRAARFRDRLRGNADHNRDIGMRFADLVALPLWSVDPQADLGKLAYAAGLLCYRPQLDQELDGLTLRSIARTTGEKLFDQVMEATRPATSNIMASERPLPTPAEIAQCGSALMDRVVRSSQPDKTGADTRDAPCGGVTITEARAICDMAYQLIQQAPISADREQT